MFWREDFEGYEEIQERARSLGLSVSSYCRQAVKEKVLRTARNGLPLSSGSVGQAEDVLTAWPVNEDGGADRDRSGGGSKNGAAESIARRGPGRPRKATAIPHPAEGSEAVTPEPKSGAKESIPKAAE